MSNYRSIYLISAAAELFWFIIANIPPTTYINMIRSTALSLVSIIWLIVSWTFFNFIKKSTKLKTEMMAIILLILILVKYLKICLTKNSPPFNCEMWGNNSFYVASFYLEFLPYQKKRVPKGIVLNQLLFTTYTNDLDCDITSDINKFADDTILSDQETIQW